MEKKLIINLLFLCTLFLFPLLIKGVEAAGFTFDQPTVSVASGSTFPIQVVVNAGSEQITSVDAYILFDSSILQAQSVTDGTFFPTVTNNISSGKIYIAGLVEDPSTYKTGSGTVATITFLGLKDGVATLTFDCDVNSSTSSKIIKNDINATNIIVCSENGSSTVTVGTGVAPTSAPPLPTSLPQTGIIDNMLKYSVPGIIILLIGGAARLLL